MWIMRVGSVVSTPSSAASGRWCSTHFDILPNCRIKSRYASRPSPVLLFLSQFMTPFGQLAAEMTQCTDKPTHRYATWCAYIDKALIKLWEPPKFYSKQYFHTRLRRFGVRNFRLWKRAHTHTHFSCWRDRGRTAAAIVCTKRFEWRLSCSSPMHDSSVHVKL